MADTHTVIGIDIGSISISIAEVGPEGTVGKTAYGFHRGKTEETLEALLSGFDLASCRGLAVTSSSPAVVKGAARYDGRVSVITAAKRLHDRFGSILIVGGEKFGLALFDEQGRVPELPLQHLLRGGDRQLPGPAGIAPEPVGHPRVQRARLPEQRAGAEDRVALRRVRQDRPYPRAAGRLFP